jgi:tol-pal system protein YbgF
MNRGSHSTARSGFQDLLTQYPNSDLAPDAQYYIGETLQAEGNTAAADSVFSLVVSKYSSAARAATALYKHGLILQKAKRDREARQAFQAVVDKYPRSDEAALAREQLRAASSLAARRSDGARQRRNNAEMPFLDHLEELRWRIIGRWLPWCSASLRRSSFCSSSTSSSFSNARSSRISREQAQVHTSR